MVNTVFGGALGLLGREIDFNSVIIQLIWVNHGLKDVLVLVLRLLDGLLKTLNIVCNWILFRS